MLSLIESGQLGALAIGNSRRSDALPEVPTIVAPAQTPDAIVRRLNQDIQRVLVNPDWVKRFREIGIRTLGGAPAQACQLVASEITEWAGLISASSISLK